MTGEVVNLRMARKRLQRKEREAAAEKNRFEYGRSKAERELARARNRLETSRHEAGRRDDSDGRDGGADGS